MSEELNGGEVTQEVTTPAAAAPSDKLVPQADVNSIIAKERRKWQAELKQIQAQAAAYGELQDQVGELLSSGLIDGVEDLNGFREKFQETLARNQSEAQKAEAQQSKLTKALEKATEQATSFKSRYEQATILRSIADHAGPKAADEGSLELIQLKLAPLAEVQEDDSVLVSWPVMDEDLGKEVVKKIPIKEAVDLMEATPKKYRGLFKATVNGGAGGEMVDGIRRTMEGEVDLASMSFEQHMELRRKNPALLQQAAEKARFGRQ